MQVKTVQIYRLSLKARYHPIVILAYPQTYVSE